MMIKVCGMRDADNIREAEKLGIDLMGLIFWPLSSRYVRECPTYLPTKVRRVGVFVDADIEAVRHTAREYALDYVQLHGHESPEYCARLVDSGLPFAIIKAFHISTTHDLLQTQAYDGIADLFLFDTKGRLAGGNGEQFDWDILAAYQGDTPFLLSGGIGVDDIEKVKNFHHQRLAGIDLNSRFETTPGLKDINKLRTFLQQLNNNE